jgi:hypothetical protein
MAAATNPQFVPPQFSKLGSSVKDLFDKKFDFKNSFTVKHKASYGVVFASSVEQGSKGLIGGVKVNHKDKNYGESEVEAKTDGQFKGSLKLKQLLRNATITASGDSNSKALSGPAGKLQAEYAQDFFAGSVSIETNFKRHQLAAAGVIGFDGLSVGGEVKLDAANPSDIEDYNVGAQYQTNDFTATVKTEKSETLQVSYLHNVRSDLQVGAQFSAKLDGSGGYNFLLGDEFKVDKDTLAKLKADVTKGLVTGAIEHRLANPAIQVGLAASFDVRKPISTGAQSFGVNLTFGDYDA